MICQRDGTEGQRLCGDQSTREIMVIYRLPTGFSAFIISPHLKNIATCDQSVNHSLSVARSSSKRAAVIMLTDTPLLFRVQTDLIFRFISPKHISHRTHPGIQME